MNFVSGIISKIFYKNADNNFIIGKIRLENYNFEAYDIRKMLQDTQVTFKGVLPNVVESENIKLFGEIVNDKKYGYQLNVLKYEKIIDNSKEGIITYLSSDHFKGVGIKLATEIYNKLKDNTLEEIANDKNVLKGIKGITNNKIDLIYETLITKRGIDKVFVDLYGLEISANIATKLVEIYDLQSYKIVSENPYKPIREVKQYSFSLADNIAFKLGIKRDSEIRLDAIILYYAETYCYSDGHTHFTLDELLIYIESKFKGEDNFDIEKLIKRIEHLVSIEEFILENNQYFIAYIYHSEKALAYKINKFNKKSNKYNLSKIENIIKDIEKNNNISYSEQQKLSVINALSNNISIITGGPGTGKTTVINLFLKVIQKLDGYDNIKANDKYALCAPTGKAAKRMSYATGYTATTIHKLLEYGRDHTYDRNSDNPLNEELIIVDETSMIDIFLMLHLFDAIKTDSRILLVGDYKQLPSIGPGQILKELIYETDIVTTKLDIIHRQGEESTIVDLSSRIEDGDLGNILDNRKSDFLFQEISTDMYINNIMTIYKSAISKDYDMYEDVQILIPLYKGDTGITYTNKIIQDFVNPKQLSNMEVETSTYTFRIDDKVMQTSNDAEKRIMNGDVGRIINISLDNNKIKVDVRFDDKVVSYSKDELIDLTLAYAISIHKSQGSEYSICIVPVFNTYYHMLNKNLLYTAITRAKKSLVLIGSKKVFSQSILREMTQRNTYLKYFIQEINDVNYEKKSIINSKNPKKLEKIIGYCFDTFGEIDMEDITPYNID